MRRRTFNKALFAAAATSLVGWKTQAEPNRKVAVVGAGLSGLVAAVELQRVGFDVTVVEASSRLGGRIDTLDLGGGQYTEAGGYAFNGIDFASPYVEELGLEKEGLGFTPGLKTTYRVEDKQWTAMSPKDADWPLALSAEERALGFDGMFSKYVAPHVQELQQHDPEQLPAALVSHYDSLSFEELIRSSGGTAAAADLLLLLMRDYDRLGAPNYSALATLWRMRPSSLGLFRIKGGNVRLCEALAARLNNPVVSNFVVRRVHQTPSGVSLISSRGQDIRSDYVVCSAPIYTLKDIEFQPNLPTAKLRLISQLESPRACRFFIQTNSRYWRGNGLSGRVFSDGITAHFWDQTGNYSLGTGVLHGWAAGPGLPDFAGATEEALKAFALEQTRLVFADIDRHAFDVKVVLKDHSVAFAPGQAGWFFDDPRTPQGRIWFAGSEVAHRSYAGGLNGAIQSGQHVAKSLSEFVSSNA